MKLVLQTLDILTLCVKMSVCYAFKNMRTIWNESTHVHLFYLLIMNHVGKHYLIQLRLGLRFRLRLQYTAGPCVTLVCDALGMKMLWFSIRL